MGYKKVCIKCRKSFSAGMDYTELIVQKCSICKNEIILLDHKFKPPKSDDDKGWKLVEFLINNGFKFQNVYKDIGRGIKLRVTYPTTMVEAKEFIKRFK